MTNRLYTALAERILLLDGGFGTMMQQNHFTEADYRGARFAHHPTPLKGCNDLLSLTQPEAVGEIHEKYLRAGADIITCNSFNANAISLSDYSLSDYAREIAAASARLARGCADAAKPLEAPLRRRLGRPDEPHRFALGRCAEPRRP